MAAPLLIHHGATLGGRYPPSSLSGLAACLTAGAAVVEIDIIPLADGDFALLHDSDLAASTDGNGPVAAATAEQVRTLRLRWRSALTDEPVGTLSQAVARVATYPDLTELQLDLKPYAPLTETTLAALRRQIKPIQRQVRVTSVADWALRQLRVQDAGLALGFDPLLYLDTERPAEPNDAGRLRIPPHHTGAYGYLDDHPLAADRWGAAQQYLESRVEVLAAQAAVGAWYVRATLLARMLADGFDLIAWLHLHGIQVCAWTLNPDQPHHIALAQRLTKLGIDRITSDDPNGLGVTLNRSE